MTEKVNSESSTLIISGKVGKHKYIWGTALMYSVNTFLEEISYRGVT
jgi:hypothetical protein